MRFLRKWGYYALSLLEMGFGFREWGQLARLFLKKPTNKPVLLHLRKNNTRIIVRSRMDAWSVKETFIDRFYERYGSEIQMDWTVVDIGAAIGEFTIFAAQKAARGQIVAFEPNTESYALLIENLSLNGIENARAINAGVWSKSGAMSLMMANDEPLQAQTQFTEDVYEPGGTIPVLTLESLIAQFTPQGIDLLKLDCEGAEYPILLTAPLTTLALIARIVMEYHDLDEEQNHRVLADYLRKLGYQVRLFSNPVHAEIGYLYAHRAEKVA
ncbi:MAG TPA: FkbM family methyltransferase [Anaerolineaceae bacterium]|nr:FkbM family methyltransferase [Anaerolineaceae bacterium]NMD27385.1 FkbM family methyltransferase [Chloroflexota bacterium]HOA21155.1 FkbM family methyltransferase [Anaerolineaceae bacterium]